MIKMTPNGFRFSFCSAKLEGLSLKVRWVECDFICFVLFFETILFVNPSLTLNCEFNFNFDWRVNCTEAK